MSTEDPPGYLEYLINLADSRNQQDERYVDWFSFPDGMFIVAIGANFKGIPGVRSLEPLSISHGDRIRIRYNPLVSLPFLDYEKGAILLNGIVSLEGTFHFFTNKLTEVKILCRSTDGEIDYSTDKSLLRYRRSDSLEFCLQSE